MKSVRERMDEFLQYHIHGDGECNNVVLKRYCDNHGFGFEDRCDIAYFFSVTYCVESAIVMMLDKDSILRDVDDWVSRNKSKLIFQSDRKYVRLENRFNGCLEYFKRNLHGKWKQEVEKYTCNGVIDIGKAVNRTQKWFYFGRFASFLFLETISWLNDYEPLNSNIVWKNGDTATSGLMDLFGKEKSADIFDKSGRLTIPAETLDAMFESVRWEIEKNGGKSNTTYVETSLCAYRKLYKGTRYNGYYLDRMLEEIIKMREDFPDISRELFQIRSDCFSSDQLGEMNGWSGIRKEEKKRYLKTGKV